MFNFLKSTQSVLRRVGKIFSAKAEDMISSLDDQDLSRFSEQDIILETEADIQKYLPDVLGQALARTWIDKRFLDAFFEYPVQILE